MARSRLRTFSDLWRKVRPFTVILAATVLIGSSSAARKSHPAENPRVRALRQAGNQAYQKGAFEQAAELYEGAYRSALGVGDADRAVQLLNNVGSARFASFRYKAALDAYLQARRLAEVHGMREWAGLISANLSSLYFQMREIPSAARAAEGALVRDLNASYRVQVLEILGRVRAWQNNVPEALIYLHAAVEAAGRSGKPGALAAAWDHLGEELLRAGRMAEAEHALLEGFRLRKLAHASDLRSSFLKLSNLRLEQHDPAAAARMLDLAERLPTNEAAPPLWTLYELRARISDAQGDVPAAVAGFRKAIAAAHEWREEIAPSDTFRSSSSVGLHRLYQSFVDASLRLPEPAIEEALLATEEYRATALRQTLADTRQWREQAPPEYWGTLTLLRKAESAALAAPSAETRARVERLRVRLAEMESTAGVLPLRNTASMFDATSSGGMPPSAGITPSSDTQAKPKTPEKSTVHEALRDIQRRLREGEALLSFDLGPRASHVWAVTASSLEMHELKPEAELSSLARRFRGAVESRSADRDRLGAQLYAELFGALGPAARDQAAWLIAADEALFDIPFAALVAEWQGGKPVYLAERHSTQHTPSALLLQAKAPAPSLKTAALLGVGDGVYNIADPRWPTSASLFPWPAARPALELARLDGSAAELKACAAAWGGSSLVLTGTRASREWFEKALTTRPAAIHIAAHVLHPPDAPEQALIDFGLSSHGEPEVLTSADIANLRTPGATVVMSGCSSARGGALPGAGVMGLSRAWLIAGASAVVGSRWPTPDDTGELFQAFYRNLRQPRSGAPQQRIASEALRQAQLEMLASSTWRSDPHYWGAFYVLGKE
jgi:CHAT domain-containing protein